VAWEALEDAGLVPEQLAGTQTGVFIGIGGNDYGRMQWDTPEIIDAYTNTGSALSIAANRISYVFDFRGPSLAVDTACSASLVTVHLACQSIWNGDSSLAIAGGVNLILSPEPSIGFSKLSAMAPDGRCKAFDARGDGYVRGEGAGLVVLKPLAQALADGDPVYAVIRGSAVNQDGRTNGLTAPNRWAQEAVLREAYRRADVAPGRVRYVEAHGTGTLLGDPIEAKALGAVLAEDRPADCPCAIGSVKTNIGHLETAAGIAGLIKVALMLKHRAIPPSLHFQEPNPHIPFDALQLTVQRTLEPWPAGDGPALAGVSSFSFGGTNAHVVLEEAPPRDHVQPATDDGRPYLLPLSAHTPEVLRALARGYREHLEQAPEGNGRTLSDICYSASVRRSHHQHRLAVVGRSAEELTARLDAFLADAEHQDISGERKPAGQRHKLVFVFPGQGSQWFGMGRTLLAQEPVFRAALEQCAQAMRPYTDWSLLEQLALDERSSRLNEIEVIQPTLFAIEVALAALWQSWGIVPDAVVGHSMGEVAAAHVAGVLSLDDAARIICRRSQLMQRVSGQGVMAVVELSCTEAQDLLAGYEGKLSVAAINNPRSTVLSGDPAAMHDLLASLERQQIFCRLIKVDVASHSPQMEPLCADLRRSVEGVRPQPGSMPMFSTVLGTRCNGLDYTADYWTRNLREPVRFATAVQQLMESGHDIFVELSPHPILLTAIEQGLHHYGYAGTVLPSLRRAEPEQGVMLESLGALYALGQEPAWRQLSPDGGHCVALPSYPWQRERFWLEDRPDTGTVGHKPQAHFGTTGHPLLGERIQCSLQSSASFWNLALSTEATPYLQDHRIQGTVLVPATAYLESVLAAAQAAFGPGAHLVEQVALKQMLVLSADEVRTVQLAITANTPDSASFQVASLSPAQSEQPATWTVHTTGTIRLSSGEAELVPPIALADIRARCQNVLSGADFYQAMQKLGFDYGPAFQGVEQVWFQRDEAIAQLRLAADVAAEADRYRAHPTILDACFQILGATKLHGPRRLADGETYLPVGLERLELHERSAAALWGYARLRDGAAEAAEMIEGDVYLLDDAGHVIVAVNGVRMQRLNRDARQQNHAGVDDWLYSLAWEARPLPGPAQSSSRRASRGSWLIFADHGGTGQALAELLEAHGERCVTVTPGETFECVAADRYRLNPRAPEAFRHVLSTAFGPAHPACRGVLHLWSLHTEAPSTTADVLAHDGSWVSTLHLVQAMAQAGWRDMPRLWLVTRGAQRIGSEQGAVSVAQAPVWGLGRTIGHEHPNLRCTRVDLGPDHMSHAAQFLFEEVWADDREEDIALRDGMRYVARLTRASLPPAEPVLFRSDGTYLITGGLGGLGLVVARWMVEHGACHVALMGRNDPSAAAREVIETLERAGARVAVVRADVAQADQVSHALEDLRRSLPPLRGVVHAAGVMDDGVLLRLDCERFKTVMAPKVAGAWNLHSLTLDDPLDCFILFSSAAALFGSPGQGNYAAANAFLDALAHYRAGEGRPALSINWGPWAEVGLAARPDRGGRLESQGLASITPAQGVELLERVFRSGVAQLGALPLSLRQWRQFYPKSANSPLFTQLSQHQEHDAAPPRERAAIRDTILAVEPGQGRQLVIEKHLREQIAHVLRLTSDEIHGSTQFQSLGFDSLMAMELRNRLETSMGLTLPATLIWTYPTVASLGMHLAGKIDPSQAATEQTRVVVEQAATEPDELPIESDDLSSGEWADLLAKELESIA
jgi:myxalamid-type polyketide synthase MxaE and MxaD